MEWWLSWLYLVVDGPWYLFYFICSLINEASLVQTTVRKNRISLPSQHLLTSFDKLWHARLRCHMASSGFWPILSAGFDGSRTSNAMPHGSSGPTDGNASNRNVPAGHFSDRHCKHEATQHGRSMGSLAELEFLDATGTRSNWSKSKLAIHSDAMPHCWCSTWGAHSTQSECVATRCGLAAKPRRDPAMATKPANRDLAARARAGDPEAVGGEELRWHTWDSLVFVQEYLILGQIMSETFAKLRFWFRVRTECVRSHLPLDHQSHRCMKKTCSCQRRCEHSAHYPSSMEKYWPFTAFCVFLKFVSCTWNTSWRCKNMLMQQALWNRTDIVRALCFKRLGKQSHLEHSVTHHQSLQGKIHITQSHEWMCLSDTRSRRFLIGAESDLMRRVIHDLFVSASKIQVIIGPCNSGFIPPDLFGSFSHPIQIHSWLGWGFWKLLKALCWGASALFV